MATAVNLMVGASSCGRGGLGIRGGVTGGTVRIGGRSRRTEIGCAGRQERAATDGPGRTVRIGCSVPVDELAYVSAAAWNAAALLPAAAVAPEGRLEGDVVVAGLLGAILLVLVIGFASSGSSSTDTSTSTSAQDTTPVSSRMTPDQAYISQLDTHGVNYSSQAAAISTAHSLCEYLGAGGTPLGAAAIGMSKGNYSESQAEVIVGASIGAYCPQYRSMLGS